MAGDGLGMPLHRLLVPARRVSRGRLGRQRAARVRRRAGGGGCALHSRRRRGTAGAAREGLHRQRPDCRGSRLLSRPADRDCRLHRDRRTRRDLLHLPLSLLQRSHRAPGVPHARPSASQNEAMADRSRLLLSHAHLAHALERLAAVAWSYVRLAHTLDRFRAVAYCKPSRASRTSVTASGNTTAIT